MQKAIFIKGPSLVFTHFKHGDVTQISFSFLYTKKKKSLLFHENLFLDQFRLKKRAIRMK